jgi:YHS domain-containing protein
LKKLDRLHGGEEAMKIAKQVAVMLPLVCIIALAGTIRANELKVRQPNHAELGMTVNCTVLNSRFEVGKDTQIIDYQGKSYYFCCQDCISDFVKNPDNYVAAGELPLREPTKDETGKSQRCPVSKLEFQVSSETPVIDYKGKSYFFCCSSCVMEFRRNPDKYSK